MRRKNGFRKPNLHNNQTRLETNKTYKTRITATFLVFLIVICLVPLASSQTGANVTVHFIDVGQGDSIFIDTQNRDVLIDGGSATASQTIIDYLEMTTELYVINTHLVAIGHRLGSGLAVVALQKKVGATYGRGQEFGLERPKLYLSMDEGRLQIVKGKSWATNRVNPNGRSIKFKIIDGCQFQAVGEWDWRK